MTEKSGKTTKTELENNQKEYFLNLLIQNDIKTIREMTTTLSNYNLNYLYKPNPYYNVNIDDLISPLILVCYLGKLDLVTLLLNMDNNIDINLASEPQNYSPLMISCFKGYYEITRILLEKKANVNQVNKKGQSALIFCFSRLEQNSFVYENRKICQMLIDLLLTYGADINAPFDNINNESLLMKLINVPIDNADKFNTVIQMCVFLLERGLDKNVLNKNNKYVFDIIQNSDYIANEYKKKFIQIINETKHIYFFSDENYKKSKNHGTNYNNDYYYSANSSKRKVKRSNEVLLETNEQRGDCCNIF